MRISKIILDHFRGYEHEEISFNRFNCIVGKNDVGKSTIFEAIKWFFDKSQQNVDENFNINLLEHDYDIYENVNFDSNLVEEYEGYTPAIVDGFTMYVEICFCEVHNNKQFGDRIFLDKIGNGHSRKHNYFFDIKDFINESNELCIKKSIQHSFSYNLIHTGIEPKITYSIKAKQFDNLPPLSFWNIETLSKKYSEFLQSHKKNKPIRRFSIKDRQLEMIYAIRMHYSKKKEYKMEWWSFDRNQTDFLAIIPTYRYFNPDTFDSEYKNIIQDYIISLLQQQNSLEIIQNKVSKELEPINKILNRTIKDNNLTLVPKINYKFNVEFDFSNGLDFISLKQRGVGIKRVLMNIIFRYIANKETGEESIFVFEEPENNLHPDTQKEFFATLKALSERYNQVMITTHSPLIVSMCNLNDIIYIKKENGISKVVHNNNTSLQEVIEDLGIGPNDSMLSIFDNYKSILFVEGKNDNYTLNKISELYKKKKDKKGKIVDKTFEEMKCLIMFIGGCSTVEEWANLGIVTKLAKPFVILLDSDKKNSGHISNNQKKLDNIYKTLNDSIETSKQAKINFCKDNFITTRKRELENYIKPSVIENYYNKKSDKNLRDEEIEDIQDIMGMIKNVELSIIAFVYKHDKSIKKYTTEALENIPVENKKEKRRQIRKEKTIELLNNYIKEYQKSNSEFQYKEWLYCKVKGIDINHYTEYKDVIGKRSYIYCMEKEINVKKYREIYNQCKWIDNNYHYLIAYVKHIDQMGGVDLTKLDSIEKFENVLDSKMKEEITHIEQAIKNTTITDVITDFCFSNEIKDNWEYIDVPLAIYCCKGHLDYNEDLPDKKSKCESIKVEINKYFFEEGNIKFEDLDFTYGDNQDEFLDIYNKIKKLSE